MMMFWRVYKLNVSWVLTFLTPAELKFFLAGSALEIRALNVVLSQPYEENSLLGKYVQYNMQV